MRRHRPPPLDHRYTTGTGWLCRVPQNICVSRGPKTAFCHPNIDLPGFPTLLNLEFPGYTLLVFRRFIFYNASPIVQVGA